MGILNLLASSNYVLFNRSIARKYSANVAILLGFLCNQASMNGAEFYYQIERIMDDTCLGEKPVRAAMGVLVNEGIVVIKKFGLPLKNHYTVDEDVLCRIVQSLPNGGTSSAVNPQFLPTGGTNKVKSVSVVSSNIQSKKDTTDTTVRHKYGAYKNVLLTDDQLAALKAEFPDWGQRIEDVSAYCEAHGKTYKNYLAVIRTWARKDKKPVEDLSARYDHVY